MNASLEQYSRSVIKKYFPECLLDLGLKKGVSDKGLDKNPKSMEDLLKCSKVTESNFEITKG